MARLIKKDHGNYTNTSNLIIRDDRLHWNSRGIFVYLWSQVNEWQFYIKEVAKHSPGGETELRTVLKELIITTSLSQQQFKRTYNVKIISRLFANTRNSIIDFSGIKDKRY